MSITDSTIRAAVWQARRGGPWYSEVYFAERRSRVLLALRCDFDRDPRTEVVRHRHASRLEALDYAADLVGLMRGAAALAVAGTAGAVSGAEALDALAALAVKMGEA